MLGWRTRGHALVVVGWGAVNPPGGCQRPSLRRLRVPSGRAAVGYRWRGFMRTARGPAAEHPCSVAAEGVSARSERGRASAERPRTCRAKQKPSRSDMGKATRGAKENSTEWNKDARPHPATRGAGGSGPPAQTPWRERWTRSAGNGSCREIRPAGGQSHDAGACGYRAYRSLRGDVGGRRPNHEGPRGERHCSVARAGGSEGCARCAARATAHSPRGKRKLHGVE